MSSGHLLYSRGGIPLALGAEVDLAALITVWIPFQLGSLVVKNVVSSGECGQALTLTWSLSWWCTVGVMEVAVSLLLLGLVFSLVRHF